MTELAEIDQRIADVKARYDRELSELYELRAASKPRNADISRWLTYMDIARRRNIDERNAPQALRRAREKAPIRERTVGRHRRKEFLESDCVAAGLI